MQSEDRLHALDAVRAWALLIGVFFHAAISFVASYAPEAFRWATIDKSQSAFLFGFIGLSHLFRMTLFFFVAGFFAHLVYHRKGAAAFARNRFTRIVVPFIVGWCVVAPLLALIWQWGGSVPNAKTAAALFVSGSDWSRGEVRLTHLWFLYYLVIAYVLVVGARHVLVDRIDPTGQLRARIDRALVAMLENRWAPAVISIPLALVAIVDSHWGGAGMPTPDHSLWPELIPLAGYGTAFIVGWLFHRNSELLQILSRKASSYFAFAGICMVVGMAVASVPVLLPALLPMPFRVIGALFLTMLTWYMDFALIGLAMRKFSRPSPRMRYVADASYWIYIAHLPVVCALQVWMTDWNLHWTIKYSLLMTIAFVVLFASYDWCVRYTFVGAVLNGRKVRMRGGSVSSALPTTSVQG